MKYKALNLFWQTVLLNIKAISEYKINFLIQLFGMILNNASFAIFWNILLNKTGSLSGYSFNDIMMLWAIVSTSFGLAHVFFGNLRSIGKIIINGELDIYLLQPRNVFFNILTSRMILSAWGDIAYGFIVLALLPDIGIYQVVIFLLSTITGCFLITGFFSFAESLTFFIGNSKGVTDAFTELLLSFSLYPEKIFSPSMRWIFYSLIPSAFIAFIPLSLMKSFDPFLLGILLCTSIIYFLLSYATFYLGLKKYESGNQMNTRL